MGEFSGRVVVVTGAGNGISREVAMQFAAKGATLHIVDLDEEGLAETARLIRETGVAVASEVVDCTSEEAVSRFFAEVGPVDILANVIGSSARGRASNFDESAPDLWSFVHQVTLLTAMLCTRNVIGGMRQRGYGRIINVSSDAALRPTVRMAEYAAAKLGVIGFTRGLAAEFGPYGITANTVAPGLIDTVAIKSIPTPLLESLMAEIPTRRLGQPSDIAHVISFLASDGASYVNGQTIAVNGGRNFI